MTWALTVCVLQPRIVFDGKLIVELVIALNDNAGLVILPLRLGVACLDVLEFLSMHIKSKF